MDSEERDGGSAERLGVGGLTRRFELVGRRLEGLRLALARDGRVLRQLGNDVRRSAEEARIERARVARTARTRALELRQWRADLKRRRTERLAVID